MRDQTGGEIMKNTDSTVLVVEDDAELLEFIASGLEEHGFETLRAAHGKEGLDRALEYIPDLVITDIMMPVMDGIALCNELKSNSLTAHIPVIMLTARNTVESQIKGLETGADDYITKPFLMTLLDVRIQNLLKTRRLLKERFRKELFNLNGKLPGNAAEQSFMELAYSTVDQYCGDADFRPEDFAAKMNMSMRNLQRKLKSMADISPLKFINGVRMAKAAKLLAGTELSVTEVSFEVGCEDTSNFTKLFKQQFNRTPSEYRSAPRNT